MDERLGLALFLQSPFSTVVYDPAGHPLAVNPAFERLWGVALDSVPEGYTVLADPVLASQGILPYIERAFQGETVTSPPVRYDIAQVSATATGRTLWTQGHFYPVPAADGELAYVVLIHLDLTERILAEGELNHSAEMLRETERMAHVGSWEWDLSSGELRWSDELYRLYGLDPADGPVTFDRYRGRIHPEDREMVQRAVQRALEDHQPFSFDHRIVLDDGTVRYMNGRGRVVMDPDGNPTRMAGSSQDITERKETEEALRRAKEEAEAANRAKSDFLAVMSHELRTPLNAIAGYAELIDMGVHGPVTDSQREDLNRIQQSQRHLLRLIEEVLDYARAEAGAVSFDFSTLPVLAATGTAEAMMLPQVEARGLTLQRCACPPDLAVRADAEKLHRILLNLLTNAVKFTHPGGRISVVAEPEGEQVAIRVEDSGIGMAGHELESIFEPFVQVGRSLSTPLTGVGLGLSISRDLARGMKGDLVVRSEPGVGSVFTILLPRAD